MHYIYIFLLSTAPVLSQNVSIKESFGIFGALNSVIGGISNFANLINSIKDIFSTVFNDDSSVQANYSVHIPEDAYLNINQLATKYGYTLEEHKVTTEDGYILTFHRIPCSRNGIKNDQVVFLMHGIMDSSDSWVLQGPDESLAYILADQGFDVWMGNARGNKYALDHVNLNPKQSNFWKFTWEEIGIHDLPAMIDYTLNVTKQENMFYVGHSQGTTSFYVMNSLKPDYTNKIKMMFSLAPVAWMRHVKSPIVRMFSPAYKIFEYLLSNFNTYSPTTDFFNKITSVICSIFTKRCDNVLSLIIGNDYKNLNESLIPVVFGHMPSGSSTLQFVHYGQLVHSGRFCRYDFGEEINKKTYGQLTPPDYDLSKLTAPVSLYYSDNDWLSDPSDVNLLKAHLVNVHEDNMVVEFNHLDFLYASTAKDLIYSRIVEQIHDFETFT